MVLRRLLCAVVISAAVYAVCLVASQYQSCPAGTPFYDSAARRVQLSDRPMTFMRADRACR